MNAHTHEWQAIHLDNEVRCAKCDCLYGGRWHGLPCGAAEEETEGQDEA